MRKQRSCKACCTLGILSVASFAFSICWLQDIDVPACYQYRTAIHIPPEVVFSKAAMEVGVRHKVTTVVNTFKRSALLFQSIKHYGACASVQMIFIVWSLAVALLSATLKCWHC